MRYQLGIILNGERTVVWKGDLFPPFGMHDVIFRMVKAIKAAFPDAQVEWFHLCDGQTYSY